ncbi:hypothetical protein V2L07_11835 [Pseudomonas alliivorans]|uniref:hypothetical protein n=1 Tax=Pseudomonas alliivorans TaxID=2810613 RepID=UPI001AE987D4|nr:hypothetical protein [Pseudomonas alliivorans]MBP0949413.1 hypothetical protein [Pseudomonas alliivorans]MEE4573464.1 hypothetical protein [Pseudomonas alliivorans]MEE5036976.1 hypothetical protein [Pseudomonas alliivorans]MEE5070922.1 hypothetical protein [Pseudomonas alliivorans]
MKRSMDRGAFSNITRCHQLADLESERFEISPDEVDDAIVLTVQELNWLLDGFDLWRNRPHKVLTPRFVA